jgi:carboxymethylenebutenolidase
MPTTFSSHGATIRIHQTEPATAAPHPALVLLHGAGGNTDLWLERIAPFAERLGVGLYAPHYFDRTNTQRADPETIQDGVHVPQWLETIADALDYVRGRPKIDPGRIALLGISLGAFLSLAHAATARDVRAVVEISGGLAGPYGEQASGAFPPTLIVHGEADPVVPVSNAHRLARQLESLRVPHQELILPGEGHWFSQGAQMRILGAVAQFLGRYL